MIAAVEHAAAGIVKVLGVPLKLSDTPGSVRPHRRRWVSTPSRSSPSSA